MQFEDSELLRIARFPSVYFSHQLNFQYNYLIPFKSQIYELDSLVLQEDNPVKIIQSVLLG